MKPLLSKDLPTFLERLCHFKDGEIRSMDILSPTEITITLTTQDSARGYDWISITLHFSGVSDAKLLQEHQFDFVDMSDGITLVYENNLFAFGIGECYNIAAIKNSSAYIIAQSLKYEEGTF